jgi:hypothetical protein
MRWFHLAVIVLFAAESDLDGNRAAARNFVLRCMQGKQH